MTVENSHAHQSPSVEISEEQLEAYKDVFIPGTCAVERFGGANAALGRILIYSDTRRKPTDEHC
jgi:hypothetical protein